MEPIGSGSPEPVSGGLRDGKDRVIASVVSLANSLGIRVLRGGGTVFARHGLISPRINPSVALIVDPLEVGRLVGALRAHRWRVRPRLHPSQLLPAGLVRLARSDFEGSLNLYGVIPGFFADPHAIFDSMWADRAEMAVGGVPVPVLDRLSTVMLAAHDRLEGQRYSARASGGHIEYFIAQFRTALDTVERAHLLDMATAFGATDELGPLLAGLDLRPNAPDAPTPEYVAARLALAHVAPGDIWIIEHLERERSHRRHGLGAIGVLGGVARLLGARSRVAARDNL